MITIIVAIARNRAIGMNNDLLWHLPEDLKRFKRITSGHCVLMGKKTWESLPVKPLPGRKNIVLTDNPDECFDCDHTARSLEEALNVCRDSGDIFVIGGGMIYSQFMNLADRLMITEVDKEFTADTFFPAIDTSVWEEVEREGPWYDKKNDFNYSYVTWERRDRR